MVAAILATILIIAPVVSAADAEYDYPENGTDPVDTFSATDPDGDPIVWGLDGDDEGDFEIADGVLTFKDSPDFEKPADEREDNLYKVTVTASGGTIDVEVTVTDVDEPGVPELDRPQPQVGRGLVADGPFDPDEPVTDVTWQWARSMDKETWEDIGSPAGSGSRNPTTDDIGMYLRATAMYTDKHGSGKTASVVSENAVEARTTSNAQPSFDDHEDSDDQTTGIQIARSVDENAKGAAVGKPISAKDDDAVLLYDLVDPDTADTVNITELFGIDSRTGQITTKVALDSNAGDTPNDTDTDEDTYTVTVTVEDPSTASASVTVVITVNNVNDAPAFGGTAPEELWVTENADTLVFRTGAASEAATLEPAAYAATDDDTADTTGDASLNLFVGGDDKGSFDLSDTGALTFMDHEPDYEEKKTYSITLMVEDDEFALGTHEVTVTVTNAEDDGTVKLNAREPQVGKAVIATLTDKDGTVRGQEWQWAKIDQTGDTDACPVATAGYTDIEDATSPSYTPEAEDADDCLRATVTYTDAFLTDENDNDEDDGDTALLVTERAVQISDPANTAPKFAEDQDPNAAGDQAAAEREVAENMETTVGDAVVADDGDLLMYAVSDTTNFKVDNDGLISTKVELDYETQSEYTVVLTATDPSGAYDTITVNITVTDENDPAVITGTKTFEYAENGTDAVATFSATDQDGDDIVWGLAGADKDAFEIADGVLTFEDSPNFESATDERKDNVYKVTVTATDGELAVEVTVTDVDEPGKPTLTKPQPQVGRGLEAEGPDDPDLPVSDVLWQWARSMDMTTWEDIGDPASSGSRNPTTDDEGHYLRATAMYTDKHGSGKTASVVSENAVEARTLANARPSFDDHDDSNDGEEGIQIARMVDENVKGAAVGKPISAKDDDDVLKYSLAGDDDNAIDEATLFDIDSRSGQITTEVELDANTGDDTDTNEVTHTVVVTVVDPSGADASVDVEILVNNVNDAPAFGEDAPKTLWVTENDTGKQLRTDEDDDSANNLDNGAYGADDDDEADTTLTYILSGADKGSFAFSTAAGVLTVASDHSPDYEKQKSYSITLMVEDDEFAVGMIDVTVNVVNAEDDGTVSLNAREPQVGRPVLATLDDKDGTIRGQSWQWYRGDTAPTADSTLTSAIACVDDAAIGTTCSIGDAMSPAYTPGDDDVGGFLTARVTYTDAEVTDTDPADDTDDGDNAFKVSERIVQISDPANTAPKFSDDQDPNTPGDQPVAEREVMENMETTVGDAIKAVDTDLLMYAISDPANFKVDNEGQISTKVKLDYEMQSEYMVMLTATDPSGAFDTIMVNITVTDEDDGAVILAGPAINTPPAFDSEMLTRSVDENMAAGASVGDPIMATDDPGDTVTYSISGSMYFAIDENSGQISTTMMLDYEAMITTHTVTVTASDEEGATDTVNVTININDAHPGCTYLVKDTRELILGLTNDCEALLDAKEDLGGDLNWSGDTNIVEWDGVTVRYLVDVGVASSRVERIWLRGAGLDGSVSAALGRLEMLTVLNLSKNMLSGEIPDLSGTMLQELYLNDNLRWNRNEDGERVSMVEGTGLSGDVPAWLNTMTDMTELWLWGNQLTGALPDLSGMTSLDRLKLNGNTALTGIDAAMLPSGLRWLVAGETGVGATAPDLSDMMSLTTLWLNDTGLEGAIPVASIPTSVTSLNLKDNALNGTIPDMSGLTNLRYLYLNRNDLSGEIPGTLGDLDSIERIWLYENDLTGISAGLANADDTLTHLFLAGNSFDAGTCLPGDLAMVENNDFETAGPDGGQLAACGDGS